MVDVAYLKGMRGVQLNWWRAIPSLCGLWLLGAIAWGQQPLHWSAIMTDPAASLGDSREAFEAHFEGVEPTRSVGVKPFQRWMWWAEKHLDQGVKPRPASWWEATESRRLLHAQPKMLSTETWQSVGPVDVPIHGGAGRINRLAQSGNSWYACAPSGGLWRSQDEGLTWDVLGVDALAPIGVTDAWVDPQNDQHLWLATGDGNGADTYSIGVLESWDEGQTWSAMDLTFVPDQGRRIHALSPHPTEVGHIWVATDIGLFQTLNGGTSFSLIRSGMARDMVWLNDSTCIAGFENEGVVRSTDGGATWLPTLPNSDGGMGRVQISGALGNDTVYAVAGHYFQQNFYGFWRSTDGGATWSQTISNVSGPNLLGYTISGADNAGQAFWDLCIELDPNNANHVLVGGVNVWETWDGGLTWNCPLHWQGALDAKAIHADQHDFLFLDNGDLLIANDGGVFRWNGTEAVDLSRGLNIAQGYAMALNPHQTGQWLLGTQDNGTVQGCTSAQHRILDGDGFQCFFDAQQDNRLFASAYYGLLYRSEDGGRTLENIATYFASSGPNELGAWETPFAPSPSTPGRIVVAKKSLHHSDDGGDTWTTIGGMGSVRSTNLAMSIEAPDAYLVSKNAQLYWKGTLDAAFNQMPGMPGNNIGALCMENADTWWVGFQGYNATDIIWKTENGGQTWTDMSSGLPALPVHDLLLTSAGTLLCASDLGVHAWNEASGSWEDLAAGLPLVPVVDLKEEAGLNMIYASTYGRGIWRVLLPDRPALDASIVDLEAPQTACLSMLLGTPTIVNTGTEPLTALDYQVALQGYSSEVNQVVETTFDPPLMPGEEGDLSPYSAEVLEPGNHEVTVTILNLSEGSSSQPYSTSQWASGLGLELTLTWWGDCENQDMTWQIDRMDEPFQQAVVLSTPLASGDSISTSICLSQGCHALVWQDQGNDGFSGDDCGESGGFVLSNSFGEVLLQESALDFGSELNLNFCLEQMWCFADYDGDGTRAVNDLLTLLSSFGCVSNCAGDNDGDGSVAVGDLMNMLSVYGTDCD